jgi:hypothetical protein
MKKNLLFYASIFLFVGLSNVFSGNLSSKEIHVRTWIGISNSNWYNSTNWSGGNIPNAGDSVIIKGDATYSPVIDFPYTKVLCNGLTLESDSLKSTRGGMTISGGEIIIDGTLTITSNATLTIDSDGALTVNGSTKINSIGGLIIESGGSLITNGSITGSAYVKRRIFNDLKWHFLSCPVTNHTILNGAFAPTAANFPTTPVSSFDFYKFNSECAPQWWINLRKSDGTVNTADFGNPPAFVVQAGYMVAYSSGFPETKIFTGTPNTGDKTYTLTIGSDLCSWNLLGNPYPSAIMWNEVSGKSNLASGFFYIWNDNKEGGAGYEVYLDENCKSFGTNGNIPSMQGFFVLASPIGDKFIGVLNTTRVHDGDYWLKKNTGSPANKLTVKFGNETNSDETYILFSSNGTTGKDWYDALKLMSLETNIPQIYTLVDNDQKTHFNSMPYTSGPVTIPIGILAPADGNYNLQFSGMDSFSSLTDLTLEDLKTNTSQNMVINPIYRFQASKNEDAGRFLLHFRSPVGISDQKGTESVKIFSVQKTIYIAGNIDSQNARVHVYNLLGQEILSQKLNNQSMNQVTLNTPDGYYLVKVQTNEYIKTVKVFIN